VGPEEGVPVPVSLDEEADDSADQVVESADANIQDGRLALYGTSNGTFAEAEFNWSAASSG
jgi:hypothetical protein